MPEAKRHSKPYQKFLKTQARCMSLAYLYLQLHRKKLAGNRDLLRSAVVLSVASMDAYFTDKFCDLVVAALKKKGAGDSLIKLLQDAGLDTREALEMLTMDRPYRRIRTLVTRHLQRHVTQRLDAIDELFVCLGIKDFCAAVQGKLQRRNLLRRVQLLVGRRHGIVHDGDYNQHHRLRTINVNRTTRQLADLRLFVEGAEELLRGAFK